VSNPLNRPGGVLNAGVHKRGSRQKDCKKKKKKKEALPILVLEFLFHMGFSYLALRYSSRGCSKNDL